MIGVSPAEIEAAARLHGVVGSELVPLESCGVPSSEDEGEE